MEKIVATRVSRFRLRSALRTITEVLAGEMNRSSLTSPPWSAYEWRLAKAVAAMHGISPLLSLKLRWRGPTEWVEFLDAQRVHTEKRHAGIAELLRRLDEALLTQHIGAVALKGAALHDLGLYQPGERPMADIDLLVQPHDARRTVRLLEALGFREAYSSIRERTFMPVATDAPADLGEHARNSLKIELHDHVGERLPLRLLDISNLILTPNAHAGLNAYPSSAALMIHLLIHAAGSMAFRALRLLQLHDIALLDAQMTETDWEQLLRTLPAGQSLRWAWPPLELAGRYYPLKVSSEVLATLRSGCPKILRAVTRQRLASDASFSYPGIDAFPGIEWSQSLPEMAAFALSRIRPSASHLIARQTVIQTQPWAADRQWSSLSHIRRVARWLVARPMRPVTLHAVHAALELK